MKQSTKTARARRYTARVQCAELYRAAAHDYYFCRPDYTAARLAPCTAARVIVPRPLLPLVTWYAKQAIYTTDYNTCTRTAAAFAAEQNSARRPLYNPLVHRTAPALYSFTFARTVYPYNAVTLAPAAADYTARAACNTIYTAALFSACMLPTSAAPARVHFTAPVIDAAARAALARALQAPAPTWQYTAPAYTDNSGLPDSVLQLATKTARAAFKFLAQKEGGKQWQDLYTAAHNYYKTGRTDNNDVMDVVQIAALAIMETAHTAAPLASNYAFDMFVKYGILPDGTLFARTYTKKDKTQVTLYGRRALQSYATIAVNKYINKQRQTAARGLVSVEKMQESLQDSYTAAPAAKCAELQEIETLQAIAQVLGVHTMEYRAAIYRARGYSGKETAAVLHVSEYTICRALARARAALLKNGIAPKTLKK